MKTLLDWLFGFFILGIADGEGEGEGAGTGEGEGTGDDAGGDGGEGDGSADGEGDTSGDDLGVDLGAADDDGVAAAAAQAAREVKEANERAERLQRELDASRRGSPQPTDEQRIIEQEDAKLRDAKTTELERWQIQSNRTLRENKRASMTALAQAQDLSDRTSFSQLAITKPGIHKRYADRVEQEITRMRAAGQATPPREALLTYMIGKDAMEGKLTPKKKAADTSSIDRGKSPGARSDVAAKGRLTDSQKREKRLENIQI